MRALCRLISTLRQHGANCSSSRIWTQRCATSLWLSSLRRGAVGVQFIVGVRLRTSLRALRGPSTTRGCSPAARPRPARGGPLGFELHLSSPQRGAYTVVTEPLRKAPSAAWSELGGRLGGLQGCLRIRHQQRRHQACAQTHLPITSRSSTASANVSAGVCGGPCARTWDSSWTPCSL